MIQAVTCLSPIVGGHLTFPKGHLTIPIRSQSQNCQIDMGVSKNTGYPKMDGENNGKPYEQMDDLGVPLFWKHPYSRLNGVANLDRSDAIAVGLFQKVVISRPLRTKLNTETRLGAQS